QLPWTAASGVAVYNEERTVKGNMLLLNRIPIRVKGKIVGAVSTMRDKTEVKKLAEELTGVKSFIEALRVQNHEHMNKLHTIAGMIQLKRYEEAIDYIFEVTEEQQSMSQFLSKNVKEYSIAGLMLGKYSRSKELKINMEIDKKSNLEYIPAQLDSTALGIILGNLLENAIEAVRGLEEERRYIYCQITQKGGKLSITVRDKGPGISSDNLDKIFVKGFSTKDSEHRGFGLALVRQYVDMAQGKITVRSQLGIGTEMVVEVG
ncbi:MAG: ATP-binding protein, partial [Bacillota bacterium]|nr:ATP-binding protein [Bacillota bacterium]